MKRIWVGAMGARDRARKASPPAFQTAPSGATGPRGVRWTPRSALCCLLFLLLLAVTIFAHVCSSALFEDASAASNFGSNILLSTPWTGSAYSVRLIDLDADGVDQDLVGGRPNTCSGPTNQLSLFARDPSSNRYVQRDYGKYQVFLG